MEWEKAMGLVDISEDVFDQKKAQEQGMMAQFLNSSLLSAFGGKKKAEPPKVDERLLPSISV